MRSSWWTVAIVALLVLFAFAFCFRAEPAGATPGEDRPHRRVLACRHLETDTAAEISRFIRCAARTWEAPPSRTGIAGPAFAVRIATCESHLDPSASNGGAYNGLFQQAARYWPSRAAHYLAPLEIVPLSVWDVEANVIASLRMARAAGGWYGDWSCAYLVD